MIARSYSKRIRNKKIAIRVDASNIIGSGHVYRCLALAEELKKKKAEPVFICQKFESDLINFIKTQNYKVITIKNNFNSKEKKILNNHFLQWSKGMQIKDYYKTLKIFKNYNFASIIIDHYGIGKIWQENISNLCKTIVIDDLVNKYHFCDMYINYNRRLVGNEKLFFLKKDCKFMTGLNYLIVNKHYKNLKYKKKNKLNRKIFIYMGSVDKNNFTSQILKYFTKKDLVQYKVYVYLGEKNMNRKKIINYYKDYNNIFFITKIVKNLRNLYLSSKIVFSSAGIGMYEQLICNSNSIIFPQNEYQKETCKYLQQNRYIKYEKSIKNLNLSKIKDYLNNYYPIKKKVFLFKNASKTIAEKILKI